MPTMQRQRLPNLQLVRLHNEAAFEWLPRLAITATLTNRRSIMKYYALVGIGETKKLPSGLVRMPEGGSALDVERFDHLKTLKWFKDIEAFKYFNGMNDDAEEISKDAAETLIEKWKAA